MIEILAPVSSSYRSILSREALAFLTHLHRRFEPGRQALLAQRVERQAYYDAGHLPDFPPKGVPEASAEQHLLEQLVAGTDGSTWQCPDPPADLEDRRVEITGPPSRKMLINALNSGAHVYMACLEDASSPTWQSQMDGQVNLREAVQGTIRFEDRERGRLYQLNAKTATLICRPRGWHLEEAHLRVEGQSVAGGLVDFGLFLFHNAQKLLARGSGPYFYLPKLETAGEAQFWRKIFQESEHYLDLPEGSIKATVLIETLPAVFHAEAILYALEAYGIGLNCGRWDYIFSYIKCLRRHSDRLLPSREQVSMQAPFMAAYSQHIISVCHRRNAHAIGGMAAQVPIKNNPEANAKAFEKIRQDKLREIQRGHDGSWVAHPALVPIVKEVFEQNMTGVHQKKQNGSQEAISQAARQATLLKPNAGTITHASLGLNIRVATHYFAAWLQGVGAVTLYHLMEDAATAEISRAQLWQWRTHRAQLETGEIITDELLMQAFDRERHEIAREIEKETLPEPYEKAFAFVRDLVFAPEMPVFATTLAYERFLRQTARHPRHPDNETHENI